MAKRKLKLSAEFTRSHIFTVREISDYSVRVSDRSYEVVGLIVGGVKPHDIEIGSIFDLDTIGRIVANGHTVQMLPREGK